MAHIWMKRRPILVSSKYMVSMVVLVVKLSTVQLKAAIGYGWNVIFFAKELAVYGPSTATMHSAKMALLKYCYCNVHYLDLVCF